MKYSPRRLTTTVAYLLPKEAGPKPPPPSFSHPPTFIFDLAMHNNKQSRPTKHFERRRRGGHVCRTRFHRQRSTRLRQYPLLQRRRPWGGCNAVRAAPATPSGNHGEDVPGGFPFPMLLLTRFARLGPCEVGSQQPVLMPLMPTCSLAAPTR